MDFIILRLLASSLLALADSCICGVDVITQMDCLEEMLGESLRVSTDRLDTSVIHPRYLEYKPKPSYESRQEERRKLILEQQKKSRRVSLDLHRTGLPTTKKESKKLEKELNNGDQPKSNKSQESTNKSHEQYKGALMMSEWMVEVPTDLEANWIIKACPQGKRVLVVANKGWTKAYGRNGHEVLKFVSSLPGGSYRGGTGGSSTCLDCILCPARCVLYVLDVIYWGADLMYCDAEFRFFWLNSKMAELGEQHVGGPGGEEEMGVDGEMVDGKRTGRRYQLELARTLDFSQLGNLPHPLHPDNLPRLDGILFYQKEGWYSWKGGKTPLVLWLKPFMLHDVLGLPVHPNYLLEKPPQYSSPKMDVTEIDDETKGINKPDSKDAGNKVETRTVGENTNDNIDMT
ncbi:hypothetical protein AAG570_005348 [Ranatra chinensis]|uniref:Snurportin-1 n=1 Tax=Ranatra chinensis TaxID=642074 RepID=A0ABD0YLY9_9HEMI